MERQVGFMGILVDHEYHVMSTSFQLAGKCGHWIEMPWYANS
jgi:hypothetical protein